MTNQKLLEKVSFALNNLIIYANKILEILDKV